MKRKIINLISTLFLFSLLPLTSCNKNEGGGDLSIFNVGEYIDPELITKFEDKYKCSVNYTTFESNEAAITKMKTEQFDVVVPSDYALEQMVIDDMIEQIDWSKLEVANKDILTEDLVNILNNLNSGDDSFDLLKWGVPYFFGEVGILFDKNRVDENDVHELGWDIFKNEKYANLTTYYDSSRDGFMVAEKALGYSMNSNQNNELEEAFNWILDVKNKTNPAFKTDELLSEMPSGKYALGLMYSGDALYCIDIEDEKVDMDFYVPQTGTNVFVDSMVIQKGARNKDLAYKFIDFMYEYDNAYQNSSYVGYSSALEEVYYDIVQEGEDYEGYEDYYWVKTNEFDEIYRYNDKLKIKLNDYWVKLKLS